MKKDWLKSLIEIIMIPYEIIDRIMTWKKSKNAKKACNEILAKREMNSIKYRQMLSNKVNGNWTYSKRM